MRLAFFQMNSNKIDDAFETIVKLEDAIKITHGEELYLEFRQKLDDFKNSIKVEDKNIMQQAISELFPGNP